MLFLKAKWSIVEDLMVSDSPKEISNYNDLLVKRFNLPNWYNNYTLQFLINLTFEVKTHLSNYVLWTGASQNADEYVCTYVSVMMVVKFYGESNKIQKTFIV